MPTPVENTIRVIWVLLIRIVAVVVGIYLLYRVRSILISLLLSIILTYALLPFVDRLCANCRSRRSQRTHRLIATIVVFIVFVAIIVTIVSFMISPLQTQLAALLGKMNYYSGQLKTLIDRAGAWYKAAVPQDLKDLIKNQDTSSLTTILADRIKGFLAVTQSTLGYLLELVLIPVLAFYFLWDYRSLTKEFYGLVPRKRRREAMRVGRDIGMILQNYVVGQLILCLIAGVVTGIVLWALGMPYVIVLALFAAITRAIPIIGPVVSGIPIVLVGLLSSGYAMALWLLLFVIVMHFAESKFIMPKFIGDRLHLHPAVVIIVLLIGAEFFGLLGMFLAAPVAAIVRELIRLYYIQPRDSASQVKGSQLAML